MNHSITLHSLVATTCAPESAGLSAIGSALRRRWTMFWMHPRTRYLSQASDPADLERRMQAWNDNEARAAAMFRNGCY